ncbi:NTP transferase domain-containing protein [Candidatus Peregrinibacteria bacterium]|nr:NTP transferase domain-containing protein [Candidatus Peregrinibacteria bacterium]
MKGIILAGGNGRRLNPLTDVTNKHLLPVYDKPMIFYPLQTLIETGIRDILIVTGKEYAGGFLKLLGSGREFGCKFTFEVQEDALGIAHALLLAADFIDGEDCAVILGDNIFEDNLTASVNYFRSGAHIFLKEMDDAKRFGVAEIKGEKIIGIEEKPAKPKTNLAVTGFYLYDAGVFNIIKNLKPSTRGELEITDVNNAYIAQGKMTYTPLQGQWTDSGTFESLYRANTIARQLVLSGKHTPFEKLIQQRNQRTPSHYAKNPHHGITSV